MSLKIVKSRSELVSTLKGRMDSEYPENISK
jgi:hypothetical protein